MPDFRCSSLVPTWLSWLTRTQACTNFTNIVDGDQSGLLGLGFQTIGAQLFADNGVADQSPAQSGATPIVQALAQSGKLPAPEFSFAFARWSDNPASYNTIEPGGMCGPPATRVYKLTSAV